MAELSEGAKKLVDLCGLEKKDKEDKKSIAEVLKEHPALIDVLDEYISYRDKHHTAIERRKVTPTAQHSLAKKVKKAKK